MIFDEDLDQKTKKLKPRDLYNLSVVEMREYIDDLKAEIVRVEADISKKEKHKASVDGLFGGK